MIAQKVKDDGVGPPVGTNSLRRLIRSLGYSFKGVDTRVKLLEKSHLREWRKRYIQKLNENEASQNPKEVIYLDESWIDCNATAKKGWTPKIMKSKRDRIDHSIDRKPGKGARLILLHAGLFNLNSSHHLHH